MSIEDDYEYFKLRKEAKTYISKLFTWNERDTDGKRNVTIVFDGNDEVKVGEVEGAMCLRLTGEKRRTQVTALVSQDDKKIRRLTLQTFKPRAGDWIFAEDKHEFTFRDDEFARLLSFLKQIQFTDLSTTERFQIEDISTGTGPKVIADATDQKLLKGIKELSEQARVELLERMTTTLSHEEINVLLGRRRGLQEFQDQLHSGTWSERDWQAFFEKEQWVFGYGLDYRFQTQFDREMTVASGGTDNQNKAVVDFLQTFRDYTALVEIKLPSTKIFKPAKGGRAGIWDFSSDFIGAVSQVVEQKARWLAHAESAAMFNRAGDRQLIQRTKNSKAILLIGSHSEFEEEASVRDNQIRRDTFELFRQENRTIDILTFDELLERAKFIVEN